MPPCTAGSKASSPRWTSDPGGGQRPHPRAALALLALLGLGSLPPTGAATPDLPAETRAALVEAVSAAATLDFYNARCRSDDSGRHSDNLNKQLVGKLRLTIVAVEDEFFPERGYRAAQKRLVEEAAEQLRQVGGCKAAKAAGLPETLANRHRRAIEAIDTLP